MQIKLVVDSSGRKKCRHFSCDKNPEFIAENGRIKKGTTCAEIGVGDASGYSIGYYCRSCIDKIYQDIKKILNPKLWIFH